MRGMVFTLWMWVVCCALAKARQPSQNYYSWEGSGEQEIKESITQNQENLDSGTNSDLNVRGSGDEEIVDYFIYENLEMKNEKIISYNDNPVKTKSIEKKLESEYFVKDNAPVTTQKGVTDKPLHKYTATTQKQTTLNIEQEVQRLDTVREGVEINHKPQASSNFTLDDALLMLTDNFQKKTMKSKETIQPNPPTTTLPTPVVPSPTPPPLCIDRSGTEKAPYVFSLSPLLPRSHVQYWFTTMDLEGRESYQNIALTIRGSRGEGRAGTQFIHTRGSRRGIVTLGPGNTGLYVRVQSHTHTGGWTFKACVIQR